MSKKLVVLIAVAATVLTSSVALFSRKSGAVASAASLGQPRVETRHS